jgi:hypothetical protein
MPFLLSSTSSARSLPFVLGGKRRRMVGGFGGGAGENRRTRARLFERVLPGEIISSGSGSISDLSCASVESLTLTKDLRLVDRVGSLASSASISDSSVAAALDFPFLRLLTTALASAD